ncbi:MAG: hypothetical protein FLDDKLPJ_02274 [Phycisphaerae bacterium]|nr:hypothetical protein [Phycisphaerae bacterium]
MEGRGSSDHAMDDSARTIARTPEPAREHSTPEVPGYRLIHAIGRGAFGEVWVAEDSTRIRRAAKLIPLRVRDVEPMMSADASEARPALDQRELDGVRAFKRAALGKPGLLQIEAVSVTPTHLYYVMELADALEPQPGIDPEVVPRYRPKTLQAVLEQRRKLPPDEALRIIEQVLVGLAELHDRGLVHFDVKPSNIVFVNGEAKLADPGLVGQISSRPTGTGTPWYLPRDERLGPACDRYAAGKVLYQLITGKHPESFPDLPGDRPPRDSHRRFRAANRIANKAAHPQKTHTYTTTGIMLHDVSRALHHSSPRIFPRSIAGLCTAAVIIALAFLVSKGKMGADSSNEVSEPRLVSAFRSKERSDILELMLTAGRNHQVELPHPDANFLLVDFAGNDQYVLAIGIRGERPRLELYDALAAVRGRASTLHDYWISELLLSGEQNCPPWGDCGQWERGAAGVIPFLEGDFLKQSGRRQLLVAVHHQDTPMRIMVVDWDDRSNSPACISDFWHYGWLTSPDNVRSVDLDGDGTNDIVLAVQANQRDPEIGEFDPSVQHAGLLALTPYNMKLGDPTARWSANGWMNPDPPTHPPGLLAYARTKEAWPQGSRDFGAWLLGFKLELPMGEGHTKLTLSYANGWMLSVGSKLDAVKLKRFRDGADPPEMPPAAEFWNRTWPPSDPGP